MDFSLTSQKNALIAYLAGLVLIILYCLWLYYPADQALFQGHDFLESPFIFFVARARAAGFLFNLDYTVPLFSDIPLNALAMRDLGLGEFFFEIFSPPWAVIINRSLSMILGVSGFFLLGKDYLLKDKNRVLGWTILVAMCFLYASLPFKEQRLSGMSMLPFLVWAGLNIYHSKSVLLSFCIFLFYPFVAFLHYNGLAVAFALGLVALTLLFMRDKKSGSFIWLTAFTGIVYAVVEYRSLALVLLPAHKIKSHRAAKFGHEDGGPFIDWNSSETWDSLWSNIFYAPGHHHFINNMPAFSLTIYAMILVTIVYFFFKKQGLAAGQHSTLSSLNLKQAALLTICASLCLGLIAFLDTYIHILQALFNIPLALRRLDSFAPLMMTIGATAILLLWAEQKGIGKYVSSVFLIVLIAGSFATNRYNRMSLKHDLGMAKNGSLVQEISALVKGTVPVRPEQKEYLLSFSQIPLRQYMYTESEYFLLDQFKEINTKLSERFGAQESYRVLNIGLTPAVANYHGYQTFGGYFYNYPSTLYFENFWPIIKDEMQFKNITENTVIPGGRLFAPISNEHFKDGKIDPHYDWCAFYARQGRAIFTPYKIINARSKGLREFLFVDPLYIYVLENPKRCSS